MMCMNMSDSVLKTILFSTQFKFLDDFIHYRSLYHHILMIAKFAYYTGPKALISKCILDFMWVGLF